eukprot:Partr_v1_DN25890_c1_g1_i2_m2619 putative Sorting and assembly machinery component 50
MSLVPLFRQSLCASSLMMPLFRFAISVGSLARCRCITGSFVIPVILTLHLSDLAVTSSGSRVNLDILYRILCSSSSLTRQVRRCTLCHILLYIPADCDIVSCLLAILKALVSSLKFGYAESIGSDSLPFAERFHMGGPLDIRGFKIRGIGPRAPALYGQRGDALGGNAYAAFGLSLFTPVPFLGRFPSLKLHAFYNSGFLANDVKVSELERTISNSVFSQTVGMGVCLKTDMCRVEANYVHPISFSRSDQLAGRFQLGVGIDFL